MYNIHLLPAAFGDSILIEYGSEQEQHYILIDGGPYYNFEKVLRAIKAIAPGMTRLELLIITHVDIDHIDGIVCLLNKKNSLFIIDQIWFNGYNQVYSPASADILGYLQGDYLSMLIARKKINHNMFPFNGAAVVVDDYGSLPNFFLRGGMEITLLSPGKNTLKELAINWKKESEYLTDPDGLREKFEKDHRYEDKDLLGEEFDIAALQETICNRDKSLANESSIAFIGTYQGRSCLFSGDATTDTLLRAIQSILDTRDEDRLKVDAWKLSHHGSKKSTLDTLMIKVEAKKVLISSDGARYFHPNAETVAKLLKHAAEKIEFYFNYRTKFNAMWDNTQLKETYRYEAIYPSSEFGISVEV